MRAPRLLLVAPVLLAVACGGDDAVDAGPPVTEITITSTGTDFDRRAFSVRAGEEVVVTYAHRHAGVQHNISFDLGGGDDPKTDVETGPDEQTVTFTAPEEGEFDYVCDVHPQAMRGTLVVVGDEEG